MFVKFQGETRYIEKCEDLDVMSERVKELFSIEEDIVLSNKISIVESIEDLGEEVEVLLSLKGGKKKKKKQYTTPKKNKHRHKSKKLHALSFYAIDKDGQVQKIKKTCPQKTCQGLGIVMAHHQNRYYCGKCYATLMIKEGEK